MRGCWCAAESSGAISRGRTPNAIDDLVLYSALAIVIGGRLGQVIFYEWPYYSAHPLEILELWNGGMSFHGGLIAACFAMWFVARRPRFPF